MEKTRTTRNGARLPLEWAGAAFRAKFAIIWEQVWPPLASFLCVTGLFLAVSWAGLWLHAPFFLRVALVFGFAVAALLALLPLRHLRVPDRQAILARLDRFSARPHRPVMALADRPVGLDAAEADPLWQAHLMRTRRRLGPVSAGMPSPGMPRRDPWALRALVLLVAIAAFVQAGDQRGIRVAAAVAGPMGASILPGRMDAWISPPAYTGRVPILLDETVTGAVDVPEGSRFVLRSERQGIGVTFHPEQGEPEQISRADEKGATAEFGYELTSDGTLAVDLGGRTIHRWPVAVIADEAPTIRLTSAPSLSPGGALELNYAVSDDYGVVAAAAETSLPDDAAARGADPLIPAPAIDLVLPKAQTRAGDARTMRDLRDHPWAGVPVRLTLKASDAAGQSGFSEPVDIVLPSRPFSRPLARAIVEQRRTLALDRASTERVARALRALTIAPEKHIDSVPVYLGINTAYWRLRNARSDDDLRGVVDYLWEVALAIEDGALSLAARNLRDIQEQLKQALQNGASDEEIRRLMDELRQAMAEFMNELARQAGDPQNLPELSQEQMQQSMSPQDLDRLMDQIEQLARSGARDAAQELLNQLQNMMNNLQMARPGQPSQQQQDMAKTLEELGDLMRRQQELMDQTFNMDRPGQQDGQGEQQGENGQGQGDREALAQQQQALRDALNDLMAKMRERGQNPEQGMGEAGQEMGEAQGNIGENRLDDAVDNQGRALDKLRSGAQSMMSQLQSQMAQQGPGTGIGRAPTDPLGRPRDQRGTDMGLGVKTPEVFDAEQARRILEELRRRLSEPSMPSSERNYLERLIEGF
ncbi:MAG: TIGR02302 family protein [Rhodobiaceae bacterium]|nr:TIGR02302 family protein [Rhodobiaceae bacterium]MCC0056832.1 TIGR02302 family protein [Rhodobiaceae bacterium]